MRQSFKFIQILVTLASLYSKSSCFSDDSQLSDLLMQINSYDSQIQQVEKDIKLVEIERLDKMGFFQQGKKSQVEEEYSLRNKLPFEYVENYKIFRNGAKKKFTLKIDHKVRNIEFIQFKQNRVNSLNQGSTVYDFSEQYIMIVLTQNNYILLLDSSGRIMHEYYSGHNVFKYAVLTLNEENVIYTLGDDFSIKSHLIRPLKKQDIEWIQKPDNNTQSSIIRIKSSKEIKIIEKPSNSTKPSEKKKILNLLIEYESEFSIQQKNQTQNIDLYTAFEVFTSKQNKYILLGDQTGHIHVYFKNGTKFGKSALSRHPIIQILKHYPYPLYATKNQIGFFNYGNLLTAYPQCDLAYDDILYVAIDGQHSQSILALQKNMDILIYDMKSQKSSCSILMKISSGDIDEIDKKDPKKVSIQQIHNFIIFQSHDSPIAKVLNITNYKSKNADMMLDVGFYLSGLGPQQYQFDYIDESSHFQYQSHKHSSNNGLVVYFEHLNSPQNSTEITLFTIYTPSPSWNFTENFKMPVIAIILIVFFFVSYCRKKKKTTLDEASMANIDNLIKDIQSGKKTIPNYKKEKDD
ncbi:hypothetical protein ABPG72_010458 [Tetrahymena utriculariae]